MGLDGDLHAQSLYQLSENEDHQDLLLDEQGMATPPVLPLIL
jgi:hypothetical protein